MSDSLRIWIGHEGLTYVWGSMPRLIISARAWRAWHYSMGKR